MYIGKGDDYVVVASTEDALARCRVHVVGPIKPGRLVELVSDRGDWFDTSLADIDFQPQTQFENLQSIIR